MAMSDPYLLPACLSAVEQLVSDLAKRVTPEQLLAHVEGNGWELLRRDAVDTAEEWVRTDLSGRRVVVVIPLPDTPRRWNRTQVVRRALDTIIEAEKWPFEVRPVLTVPKGLR